jgi:hypothetical protein
VLLLNIHPAFELPQRLIYRCTYWGYDDASIDNWLSFKDIIHAIHLTFVSQSLADRFIHLDSPDPFYQREI